MNLACTIPLIWFCIALGASDNLCDRKGKSQMFDFNGDGKTDLGEQYTGYKIFEDVTKSGPSGGSAPRVKLSGFDIVIIVLIAYCLLNTICGWLY